MQEQPLKTMKEVADHFNRPAHRIIHLCETEVIKPTVDAKGRGTVRRFSRDDTFRVLIALQLQEAGVQVPLIKPLMRSLDNLMAIREVKKLCGDKGLDLVDLIRHMGSEEQPVIGFLTPPDRVALITPRLSIPSRPDVRVDLHMTPQHLLRRGVSIVANLSIDADYVANTLWLAKPEL
jgi:DNA-binding transcriptional MerR regulator